jgi:hypothetical protein
MARVGLGRPCCRISNILYIRNQHTRTIPALQYECCEVYSLKLISIIGYEYYKYSLARLQDATTIAQRKQQATTLGETS